jgi:hypothetical protein
MEKELLWMRISFTAEVSQNVVLQRTDTLIHQKGINIMNPYGWYLAHCLLICSHTPQMQPMMYVYLMAVAKKSFHLLFHTD